MSLRAATVCSGRAVRRTLWRRKVRTKGPAAARSKSLSSSLTTGADCIPSGTYGLAGEGLASLSPLAGLRGLRTVCLRRAATSNGRTKGEGIRATASYLARPYASASVRKSRTKAGLAVREAVGCVSRGEETRAPKGPA